MTEDSARSRHKVMPDLLLVEDNPLHLRLVKSMLADIWPPNEVAEVRHARSLEEAITEIRREPPACVLLDLILPDSDGMDSLDGVRAADPFVPIVILSSHEDSDMARRAITGGAQDYLVKGAVSPEDLERSVAFAMGRKDHERQKVAETPGITPWPVSEPDVIISPDVAEPTAAAADEGANPEVGIAIVNDAGAIMFIEPAVAESLGREMDEIAVGVAEDMLHPNDVMSWKKLMAGDPGPADIRFLHPSGHPIFFRVSARHVMASAADADGAVVMRFHARSEVGTASSGAYVVMTDWG
jgi:DNA-binding NarL/FixJ family response regulator